MLLHDKLKPYRLILASQSPRRQQLLAESGLPYEPAPRYDCQEVYRNSRAVLIPGRSRKTKSC